MEFKVAHQGVTLCGTRQGSGEPVLMIHGAGVDRSFYKVAARELSSRFEVVTYDRRGYSESALPGQDVDAAEAAAATAAAAGVPAAGEVGEADNPIDSSGVPTPSPASDAPVPDCSVATQAEDAARIIRAFGGGEPMHVVAHSGGCTIAMELARLHPNLVRRVILDEPFIVDCLPEGSRYESVARRIMDAVSNGNEIEAVSLLAGLIGASDPRSRSDHSTPPDLFMANNSYFIRNEFSVFSSYVPDYEALRGADLRIFSSELDHGEEYPQCAREMGERLDAPVYYVPGTHNFPTDLPEEFARFVAGTLLL